MQQIGFLLQNLLSAQQVSCTIMPIIRSSRDIQMVAACGALRFGLQVVGLVWSYWCTKHVERTISFAIKNQSVASS